MNNNETETYVDDVNSGLELDHCENDSEELSRSTYTNFFDGRRIVEFSVLVDHLERGCVVCHKPLNLAKCIKEKQYGLASLLYIECTCCNELTIVPTGKRHNIGANGQGPFDVNTKLGVGMYMKIYTFVFIYRFASNIREVHVYISEREFTLNYYKNVNTSQLFNLKKLDSP